MAILPFNCRCWCLICWTQQIDALLFCWKHFAVENINIGNIGKHRELKSRESIVCQLIVRSSIFKRFCASAYKPHHMYNFFGIQSCVGRYSWLLDCDITKYRNVFFYDVSIMTNLCLIIEHYLTQNGNFWKKKTVSVQVYHAKILGIKVDIQYRIIILTAGLTAMSLESSKALIASNIFVIFVPSSSLLYSCLD